MDMSIRLVARHAARIWAWLGPGRYLALCDRAGPTHGARGEIGGGPIGPGSGLGWAQDVIWPYLAS